MLYLMIIHMRQDYQIFIINEDEIVDIISKYRKMLVK